MCNVSIYRLIKILNIWLELTFAIGSLTLTLRLKSTHLWNFSEKIFDIQSMHPGLHCMPPAQWVYGCCVALKHFWVCCTFYVIWFCGYICNLLSLYFELFCVIKLGCHWGLALIYLGGEINFCSIMHLLWLHNFLLYWFVCVNIFVRVHCSTFFITLAWKKRCIVTIISVWLHCFLLKR